MSFTSLKIADIEARERAAAAEASREKVRTRAIIAASRMSPSIIDLTRDTATADPATRPGSVASAVYGQEQRNRMAERVVIDLTADDEGDDVQRGSRPRDGGRQAEALRRRSGFHPDTVVMDLGDGSPEVDKNAGTAGKGGSVPREGAKVCGPRTADVTSAQNANRACGGGNAIRTGSNIIDLTWD